MNARARDERGSVAPMIIGFFLVVALLVAVVVDASAAYLRHQDLDSVADAAALAATDGLQGDQVYTSGLGERALIDPVAARGYVEAYVAASGVRSRFPGLNYAVSSSAQTVVVRVSAPMRLPLRAPGAGEATVVRATAASTVIVSD